LPATNRNSKSAGATAPSWPGWSGSGRCGPEWRGAPLYLNTHLTYDWFFDNLNFMSTVTVSSRSDQWELGLALGGGRPLEFGFLSFDQAGSAYRWSSTAT
jgi:hypothetical protein